MYHSKMKKPGNTRNTMKTEATSTTATTQDGVVSARDDRGGYALVTYRLELSDLKAMLATAIQWQSLKIVPTCPSQTVS